MIDLSATQLTVNVHGALKFVYRVILCTVHSWTVGVPGLLAVRVQISHNRGILSFLVWPGRCMLTHTS